MKKQTKLQQMEETYLEAKDAYYNGKPFLTDSEFDELESNLVLLGSKVVNKVGAKISKNAIPHLFKMKSLEKIQVKSLEEMIKLGDDLKKWVGTTYGVYSCTPKFDGNALSLTYKNGKLESALTRGDGSEGMDITPKMAKNPHIPNTISDTETIVVRGEVVMDLNLFYEKYFNGENNPRNVVSGILNEDKIVLSKINDIVFVAYKIYKCLDGKEFEELDNRFDKLYELGFNKKYEVFNKNYTQNTLELSFDEFLAYRKTSEFALDGYVIDMPKKYHKILGETIHHPKYSIAIKFPATKVTTKIIGYSAEVSKAGILSPVCLLEKVLLDGSVISRVSAYNYGTIEKEGWFIGTEVEIEKSGDIIPRIVRVVNPSYSKIVDYPKVCTCGKFPTFFDGVNLKCQGHSLGKCTESLSLKLGEFFEETGFKGLGGVTLPKMLVENGLNSLGDIFDRKKWNDIDKINGRITPIISDRIKKKPLEVESIIKYLLPDGLGRTASERISNFLYCTKDNEMDISGLNSKLIESFKTRKDCQFIVDIVNTLEENGATIKYPESVTSNMIVFEMTGSPDKFGIRTKEDFVLMVKDFGYRHGKLKDAKLLITDDLNSNTTKMKDACKKGIEIKTYGQLLDMING